jgi:hypothetical protein
MTYESEYESYMMTKGYIREKQVTETSTGLTFPSRPSLRPGDCCKLVFTGVVSYTMDTYRHLCASALAAIGVLRCVLAAAIFNVEISEGSMGLDCLYISIVGVCAFATPILCKLSWVLMTLRRPSGRESGLHHNLPVSSRTLKD